MGKSRFWYVLFALVVFFTTLPVIMAEESSHIDRTTVSGMNILLQKNQSEVAQVTLLLKSGSNLEPADKKGTAYIMNQIVNWIISDPKTSVGDATIETMPDYTVISFETLAKNINPALGKVKELLTEPLYDYDVVFDLKKLMSTGINALPGFSKSYAGFTKEFYGADSPYNDWPTPESMKVITGPDVYKWYRQTYQPGNAILSISGKVNQNIGDLGKFFANLPSESVDHRMIMQPVIIKETKQIHMEDPNGKESSICIGFSAPKLQDPDYPAFKIMAYYLGDDYMHYFEELRVKDALFYTPAVYYNILEKPGAPNIAFLSMTDPDSVKRLETRTIEVVNQLSATGIGQSEIDKVVKAIQAGEDARKASGDGIATLNALSQFLGTQAVYFENQLPKLKQVTTEDIKRVAAKYFKNYIEVSYTPKEIAKDW